MSCEICGRSNCTRSFHSFEAQDEFDNIADGVKDRMRNILIARINRIKNAMYDNVDNEYVLIDDVINIIKDY